MDDADRAAINQQQEIEREVAKRQPVPPLKANGVCKWCESPVGPRQKFCDPDCSEDFEKAWKQGVISYGDI